MRPDSLWIMKWVFFFFPHSTCQCTDAYFCLLLPSHANFRQLWQHKERSFKQIYCWTQTCHSDNLSKQINTLQALWRPRLTYLIVVRKKEERDYLLTSCKLTGTTSLCSALCTQRHMCARTNAHSVFFSMRMKSEFRRSGHACSCPLFTASTIVE